MAEVACATFWKSFRWGLFFLVLVALTSVGCKMTSSNDITNGGRTIHKVDPVSTDSQITSITFYHYAGLNTSVTLKNVLLLFLGGTGSDPANYSQILKVAIDKGYHVISLAYPNSTSVGSLCGDNVSYYGGVRQAVLEGGTDPQNLITVTLANSIVNRLGKLLAYLVSNYPSEHWDQFLSSGSVVWSSTVVAGFSQGAGHAAFIAKNHAVIRAILFSGVVDGRVTAPPQSADWISNTTWATSTSSFLFFASQNDGYYPAIKANMITLGQNPDTVGVSVDSNNPPYGGSRVLLTSIVSGSSAHPSTCEDSSTPMNGGTPVYAPAWGELFSR